MCPHHHLLGLGHVLVYMLATPSFARAWPWYSIGLCLSLGRHILAPHACLQLFLQSKHCVANVKKEKLELERKLKDVTSKIKKLEDLDV